MHPAFQQRLRIVLYLVAWLPLLALLSFTARRDPATPWPQAAALLAPATLVLAFVCLGVWYICRVRPLRLSEVTGLATTWTFASAAAGLLFGGIASLTGYFARMPFLNIPALVAMGTILYLLSAGIHYAVIAGDASRAAESREAEARNLARDAELYALRMQINPHFLFNSLNSIAALSASDGPRAREMCIRLSDFLRSSLGLGDRESIPLREELAHARRYLEVEQVRFGERLRVMEEVGPGCEECLVPALLLQPLVENAVKHGVSGMLEGGEIRIRAARHGDAVKIEIENGFDEDNDPPARLGIGLKHVRRRLEVRYGARARMIAGVDGGLYRVELRLPC
jgi:hypothetical protein